MALHPNPTLFGFSWIATIIALLISLAPMLSTAQLCYSPSGTTLKGFGFCNPANSTSVCCKLTESCVENGLCSTPYGFLYRGGCSDGSFKSESCPINCIDNYDRPWVTECHKHVDGSGVYCCDNDVTGDCCNSTDTFTISSVVTTVKLVSETTLSNYATPLSSTNQHPPFIANSSAAAMQNTTTTSPSAGASSTKPASLITTPTGSQSTIVPSNSGTKTKVGIEVSAAMLVAAALFRH